MADSDHTAAASSRYEPVSPTELEEASHRAAQAASTARIISNACHPNEPEVCNALGLLAEYLHQVASDLNDMHMRHAHLFAKGGQS